MGGKTTKLFRNSNQSTKTQNESEPEFHEQLNTSTNQPDETIVKDSIGPFVHYRKG